MADPGLKVVNNTTGTVKYQVFGIVPNTDPIPIPNASGILQASGSRTFQVATGYADYSVTFSDLQDCSTALTDENVNSSTLTLSLTAS